MSIIDNVLSRLQGVQKSGTGWKALCPAHDDQRQSLTVGVGGDGRVLLKCHAGCSVSDICSAMGLSVKDLFPGKGQGRGQIAATYDYHSSGGKLLFQVCRTSDKRFFQRRPGGGGWINGLGDVKPVLYRLPAVLEAVKRGEMVFVAEGEKDVDNLVRLGLAATTSPMGAGKWRQEYAGALAGASVVILPDNDEPGCKHAEQVAQSLQGKAAAVKVLKLPNLPEKGDVSNWLAAGGTKEELLRLAAETPEWEPRQQQQQQANWLDTAEKRETFSNTDLGNAERLIAAHGSDLRYCHPWKKWLVWDGSRWREDDTADVMRRAKTTVRAMYAEAAHIEDDKQRREFLKFVMRSEHHARLEAMTALAASEPGIPVLPAALDTNPWLLNCANGTVDLRSGELMPHRRDDMLTKVVNIEYDASAKCPRWMQFLYEITAGDESLISFLQRAAGYSLTGETSEHVLFILWGSGRNGKSTFLNILLQITGEYGMTAAPDLLLARGDRHPTELADLAGRRLVVAVESGEGRRLNEALVKQLTGGDTIKARRMREDFWQFNPTHKLWLATNHRPRVRGTDLAIWSRLKLIPFCVSFTEERQDKQLIHRLRNELTGILRWCVEGCLAWQREGLGVPEVVETATDAYRSEQDVLAAFLGDCCIVNPAAKAAARDLYETYVTWCRDNGEHVLSQREFGMRLAERGLERFRGGRAGAFMWRGLGLLTAERTEPY